MMGDSTPHERRRLRGIDASRGAAMLFVCLSHFSIEYFRPFRDRPEAHWLLMISLIASPTFMLVSGMMATLLTETAGARFPTMRAGLASRGVFLLTVGHALIVISCLPTYGLSHALWRGFITDAIGVSIIVGPWLVRHWSTSRRLLVALGMYALGAVLVVSWTPEPESSAWVVRFVLVGPEIGSQRFNFPLLPWLALYLVGTACVALNDRNAWQTGLAEQRLLRGGVVALTLAVILKGAYWMARSAGALDAWGEVAYAVTSPFQKLPPSPAYFLGFGGLGLLMTSGLLAADRHGRADRLLAWLATLGRASLFVFLLQFYVYNVLFHYLALPYTGYWPLYYLVSVLAVHGAARWWLARNLNLVFDMRTWFTTTAQTGAKSDSPPLMPPAA